MAAAGPPGSRTPPPLVDQRRDTDLGHIQWRPPVGSYSSLPVARHSETVRAQDKGWKVGGIEEGFEGVLPAHYGAISSSPCAPVAAQHERSITSMLGGVAHPSSATRRAETWGDLPRILGGRGLANAGARGMASAFRMRAWKWLRSRGTAWRAQHGVAAVSRRVAEPLFCAQGRAGASRTVRQLAPDASNRRRSVRMTAGCASESVSWEAHRK